MLLEKLRSGLCTITSERARVRRPGNPKKYMSFFLCIVYFECEQKGLEKLKKSDNESQSYAVYHICKLIGLLSKVQPLSL